MDEVGVEGQSEADADRGPEVESAEAICQILPDADSLLGAAEATANKDALRSATDAAIAACVFGVPTIVAEDQLFWGG